MATYVLSTTRAVTPEKVLENEILWVSVYHRLQKIPDRCPVNDKEALEHHWERIRLLKSSVTAICRETGVLHPDNLNRYEQVRAMYAVPPRSQSMNDLTDQKKLLAPRVAWNAQH